MTMKSTPVMVFNGATGEMHEVPDLEAHMKDVRRQWDTAYDVAPEWQRALAPGDHFATDDGDGGLVFGEILHPEVGLTPEEIAGGIGDLAPGFRWVKLFYAGTKFPDGEFAHKHVTGMKVAITGEMFGRARATGWRPDRIDAVHALGAPDGSRLVRKRVQS